jgi:hypothetical protein
MTRNGVNGLVGESVDRLVWVLADLLVRPLQPNPHDPRGGRGRDGECGGGAESDGVAWCVGVHPKVLQIDVSCSSLWCSCESSLTGVHTNEAFAIVLTIASAEALFSLRQFLRILRDYSVSNSLLLFSLATCGRYPAKNNGIDRVRANGEDNHGEVFGTSVQGGEGENETEDSDRFCNSDVPCALVETTRRPRPGDRDEASNEVGWASESESDGLVETKSLDSSGEEVFEAVSSKVHVLHEGKEPQLRIACSLLETSPRGYNALLAHSIEKNTIVRQQALFGSKPLRVERVIGEDEGGYKSNDECGDALDNEQPLPSRLSGDTVQFEDADSDQTSESGCENVACVQDRDTRGNLLASVEDGEHVERTRVLQDY